MTDIAKQAKAELAPLSPREREFLILAGKGLSLLQVAQSMNISYQMSKDYSTKVRLKLAMTMIEAAVLATKAGWL
jgi:DNA-binding CsgD family transcriptional regulator